MEIDQRQYLERIESEERYQQSQDPVVKIREFFIRILSEYYTSNIIPVLTEDDIDFMEKSVERVL